MRIETNINGDMVLKEVYNGILLETEEGNQIAICMRDDTFEIKVIDRYGNEQWNRVNMETLTVEEM